MEGEKKGNEPQKNKGIDKTINPNTGVSKSKDNNIKPQANQKVLKRVIKKRYQIEGLVGHGGMCDVYRAKDLLLEAAGDSQPYVAIKLLQKEFYDQPDAARILIREARKTQRLSHPNIIRVHDFGVDQEDYYLVMEWLDGQTLDEVIKSHRPNGLAFKNSLALLKQLISALRYAHANGVVHADLKPGNIMLSRDGTIKIFDFGVSRALNLNADQYAADKPEDTSPVSGFTPTYASPELLSGAAPSIADDVFAFSCIAYELLSSKHPFNRKTANQAKQQNIKPSKPKQAPLLRWPILKNSLNLDSAKRISDLDKIEKSLTKRYLAPSFSVVVIAALIGASLYGYQQLDQQLATNKQQLALLQQQNLTAQELLALSPQQFLPKLETIPADLHLPKQALLRDKRRLVIEYYEKKIDDLLNNRNDAYPDYYAIQSLLQQANQIYPDSYALALIAENISQGWMGTIEALNQRLNTHLEQGRYQHSEQGDDIYTIYSDLKQVKTDYQFSPNEKSIETFAKSFDKAAAELNVVPLAQVLEAGETFFANIDSQQQRISNGLELKHAITAMAEYQEAIDNDSPAEFPYQAAELFYQDHFQHMQTRISQLTRVKSLDKVVKELDKMAKGMPDDFSHLVETRQTIVNKYLRFSDYLLQHRRNKEARAVMKKAQDLMTKVQETHVVRA
ncbi:serine/threonine-protein kinase [Agarivorans gilvus]|uniref:Serine/threonine protein kinase n=1 Tax=Agarivorans gilvus TaxID=680279 RepID=A0ABQ1I6H8_9ALTE|nr:serine/threonine-protein kinase [Agarivorans gilvus]GGB20201.1 serine/threonine protein kinase [Agarivorans gilvus]